ncbi:hypothetical protein [Sphingobium chlorophenolicum]|uniref:hypothetical protein n=1 Tax=Sphingobium chlorophenolicum TaxID=46429 RepID=UPI000AFAB563|nr:hypothetical protein [Sphingobium chlorophenolicum]
MVHPAAPPAFLDISALASFRDLIAIATTTYGRALELRHRRGHRVIFGEAFAMNLGLDLGEKLTLGDDIAGLDKQSRERTGISTV